MTNDEMNFIFPLDAFSWKTMKLTATVLRFADAFLIASFLSQRCCLSASGRSLSFSR
jgi:hypothetical protein